MNATKHRNNDLEPWNRMGLSRRRYLAIKPWEAAELPRDWFEEIVRGLTRESFHQLRQSPKC